MTDWRADRVGSAIDGSNPTVLAELEEAFAVIGDTQFLPGYSLAITRHPGVDRLSDLPRLRRVAFLADVDLVASAVENVCSQMDSGYRRVNIEILGNSDAFLHAHVFPRYEWESVELRPYPVWLYPRSSWTSSAYALGEAHRELRRRLTEEILRLRDSV